jgi:hypothetical protein
MKQLGTRPIEQIQGFSEGPPSLSGNLIAQYL